MKQPRICIKYIEDKFGGKNDLKLFNVALSSEIGEADFHINNSLLTNSLFESFKDEYTNSQSSYNTKEKITVKTNTIDNFCKSENIDKIDAQGADIMVLKGAEQTLKDRKIDIIFVEVEFLQLYKNQPLFHELSSFLHLNGYYLYSLYNISVSGKGQMICGDAVFLSPDIKI